MPAIQVPVLTVSTNEGDLLERWIANVRNQTTRVVQPVPFVADNASSDRTASVLWDAIRTGVLAAENILSLQVNLGFPAAQNQLIRKLGTKSEYRWFAPLNIDAIPRKRWLHNLVEVAGKCSPREKFGMFGGIILTPDKPRTVSTAGHALRKDGAFLDIDFARTLSGQCFHRRKDFEPFSPCFAASLWSVDLLRQCGLPSSSQFLYYDDVELGYKARLNGWRAKFVPSARATHPLPNVKKSVPFQRRLQRRGQLTIIYRYLPDAIRRALLAQLDQESHEILANLNKRELNPYLSDKVRARVYRSWSGRWIHSR